MMASKTGKAATFFLLTLLGLWACKKDITTPGAHLDSPHLLASPSDTDWNENGIDAIPESDAIQIQWELNPLYEGYKLYRRSQDEDDFSLLRTFGAEDSLYVDRQNMALNIRYYYYLVAHDGEGHQSEPSDTVSYMLVAKAFNLFVSKGEKVVFNWQFHDFSPELYILKLFDDSSGEPIWLSEIQPSYTSLEEHVEFNWDNKARMKELEENVVYRWRIDIRGPAKNCGSESNWSQFIYQR